ncbi:copper chaperone PCu(A)C [Marinomonas ostreistagni]|uniref:copper chaperone PCu(A)C n=1 Tax=Marinomonas ostreistagni TaxID=359209 RepID=UPI001950F3A4|nr:copper chaperone PCu(A)C [Marinomonas ostreistagni]MBM6550821.1 copper chaperone PCu(A)C [Marinomonas ostreistagni]
MSLRVLRQMLAVCAALTSTLVLASDIEISQPAVRAMPPGAPASGAYVTLTNHSDQVRHLVSVESDAAKTVEIHLSEMQGDTMKMSQVASVTVPAHGQVALRPGSYHIMMMGLTQPIKVGDQIDFTLVMQDGERIAMQAPVLGPEDMARYTPAMKHKMMDHSQHQGETMDHGAHQADHAHH